jgi:hypothetical protein
MPSLSPDAYQRARGVSQHRRETRDENNFIQALTHKTGRLQPNRHYVLLVVVGMGALYEVKSIQDAVGVIEACRSKPPVEWAETVKQRDYLQMRFCRELPDFLWPAAALEAVPGH